MKKYFIKKIKPRFQFLTVKSKTTRTNNCLRIGQKFMGKLKNKHQGKILIITERMLLDDENTIFFLHYYGFEEIVDS